MAPTLAVGSPATSRIAPRRLSWTQLGLYALPSLSISMMIMPVATVVPNLYVKERGIALATMGVILMVARIFDAVADQVVGYLSDATRGALPGGRKAWLVMGSVLAAPSIYMLFNPPANVGAGYFVGWSLAAYLAWAMLLIPYSAWGAELSRGYHERTRIAATRSFVSQIGPLAFLGMPLLLESQGLAKTSAMDLSVASYVAIAVVVLLPLTIVPAVLAVPQGVLQPKTAQIGLLDALRSLVKNRPLLILMGGTITSDLGYGILATVVFIYLDAYLGIGAQFSIILICSTLATLASLKVWELVARVMGKKHALMLGWALQSVTMLGFIFVKPGPESVVPFTAILCVNSFCTGAGAVIGPSMMADVIDYDTLKTGGYRAGAYFAVSSLIDKIVIAFGGGLAFLLLGWAGYSVANPALNTEAANHAMVAIFAVAPAVLRLVALLGLAQYPLNPHRQGVIRRRLEQREASAMRPEGPVPTKELFQ